MSEKTVSKNRISRRVLAIVLMAVTLLGSLSFMQKYLCIPYSFDQNRAIMLHKEPAESIDVLLVGSSTSYSGFSSVYAYEKFGFTSYPYAIGGSTCTSWKPAVQDALKSQSPKLIVVDVFGGGYELDLIESRNNQFYTIMSHTPLSKEKIETAEQLSEIADGTSTSSLLFPILKYHNSVPGNLQTAKDSWDAFHSEPSRLKGVEVITRTRELSDVDSLSFTEESADLDEKTEGIIRDFMDYCRSENLKLLFVKYPTVLTENDPDELLVNLKANRILEIARDEGFATLNMQKEFKTIGLKEREDYYNHGHTNTRGQRKVTEYLGSYIQNEMGIASSELSDGHKKAWDDCIPYYKAYCELAEELIKRDYYADLGDCPALTDDLAGIISGEDIAVVAEKYKTQ